MLSRVAGIGAGALRWGGGRMAAAQGAGTPGVGGPREVTWHRGSRLRDRRGLARAWRQPTGAAPLGYGVLTGVGRSARFARAGPRGIGGHRAAERAGVPRGSGADRVSYAAPFLWRVPGDCAAPATGVGGLRESRRRAAAEVRRAFAEGLGQEAERRRDGRDCASPATGSEACENSE